MDPFYLVPTITMLLPALVLQFTARGFARNQIELNSAIGIRTRYTMANETAWQAGHRAALGHLRAMYRIIYAGSIGALVLGLSLPTMFHGISEDAVNGAIGGWVLLCIAAVLYMAFRGTKVANAAAKPFEDLPDDEVPPTDQPSSRS